MNKKILISDYDQTFYLNDEDMEKNKKVISKFIENGNIFVIATGRSYLDFYNKVNLYNFMYDYVILNHGATILDKNDKVISNFSINNEIIKDIEKDLQLEKSINNFCCSKLESRVDFNYKDLTKINVRYQSYDMAVTINNLINSKYKDYVNSYYVNNNSIEIISNKIDKSKAINLLLDNLNISKDNIYVIGDGYSDIQMIKDFKGYAMVNSIEEVKQNAKKEYKSVSELVNEIIE